MANQLLSFEFKMSSKDAQLAEYPLYNKILASLQKEFGFSGYYSIKSILFTYQ